MDNENDWILCESKNSTLNYVNNKIELILNEQSSLQDYIKELNHNYNITLLQKNQEIEHLKKQNEKIIKQNEHILKRISHNEKEKKDIDNQIEEIRKYNRIWRGNYMHSGMLPLAINQGFLSLDSQP